MNIYIRSTGIISPQRTIGPSAGIADAIGYTGNRLACVEPDYKEFIDPKLIRRMSRVIRMGVAAAKTSLMEAGVNQPDAILTGTAYGCLEDTAVFLSKMVENKEEMLAPTAFIQSTHNTIGAQIALLLNCHQYNNTFVHRGFSFESALLDSIMLIKEIPSAKILTGAVDEITDVSHAILSRFNLYKDQGDSSLDLYNSKSGGTIAGEGASFFVLASGSDKNNYAKLDAVESFYNPGNSKEIEEFIVTFLSRNSIKPQDLDLVILGKNGDWNSDKIYTNLEHSIFKNVPVSNYKHLCGEYPTSTGFAMWMAALSLRDGRVPFSAMENEVIRPLKRVLIYNHHLSTHHSLLLLSAC